MGILRTTPSSLSTTTGGNDGLLVFTKSLAGFDDTILYSEHNISSILYVDIINQITQRSVSVVTTVVNTTINLDSNVDLTDHTLVIKGI